MPLIFKEFLLLVVVVLVSDFVKLLYVVLQLLASKLVMELVVHFFVELVAAQVAPVAMRFAVLPDNFLEDMVLLVGVANVDILLAAMVVLDVVVLELMETN